MAILTNLEEGKKILFDVNDGDTWGYDPSQYILQQYVNGNLTGNKLNIISVDQNTLTIDWGEGIESSLQEIDFYWAD